MAAPVAVRVAAVSSACSSVSAAGRQRRKDCQRAAVSTRPRAPCVPNPVSLRESRVCPPGDARRPRSAGQALDRVVLAAEPLRPRRDLEVTQTRVIPAVAADDLEESGVAVSQPTFHRKDALVSQARRLLAGHSGQTVAAHQHSWLVVHRCQGPEQRDDAYRINQTPAQPPVPLLDLWWSCGPGALAHRRCGLPAIQLAGLPYPGEIGLPLSSAERPDPFGVDVCLVGFSRHQSGCVCKFIPWVTSAGAAARHQEPYNSMASHILSARMRITAPEAAGSL